MIDPFPEVPGQTKTEELRATFDEFLKGNPEAAEALWGYVHDRFRAEAEILMHAYSSIQQITDRDSLIAGTVIQLNKRFRNEQFEIRSVAEFRAYVGKAIRSQAKILVREIQRENKRNRRDIDDIAEEISFDLSPEQRLAEARVFLLEFIQSRGEIEVKLWELKVFAPDGSDPLAISEIAETLERSAGHVSRMWRKERLDFISWLRTEKNTEPEHFLE